MQLLRLLYSNPEINDNFLSKCMIELLCSASLQKILQSEMEIFENFMNEANFISFGIFTYNGQLERGVGRNFNVLEASLFCS